MIKKGFASQNVYTSNTSVIGQNVKKEQECVACVAWEPGCKNGHHPVHILEKYRDNNITS